MTDDKRTELEPDDPDDPNDEDTAKMDEMDERTRVDEIGEIINVDENDEMTTDGKMVETKIMPNSRIEDEDEYDDKQEDEEGGHDLIPDRLYIQVFAALVVLTLLEVAGVLLDLATWVTMLYVLGLAILEALLIATFFMHLRWEDPFLRKVALLPIFFIIVLVAGVGLTSPDSPDHGALDWLGL